MHTWVGSIDFDDLLVRTVRSTYPAHEQDEFVAHFRGLLKALYDDAAGSTD